MHRYNTEENDTMYCMFYKRTDGACKNPKHWLPSSLISSSIKCENQNIGKLMITITYDTHDEVVSLSTDSQVA